MAIQSNRLLQVMRIADRNHGVDIGNPRAYFPLISIQHLHVREGVLFGLFEGILRFPSPVLLVLAGVYFADDGLLLKQYTIFLSCNGLISQTRP